MNATTDTTPPQNEATGSTATGKKSKPVFSPVDWDSYETLRQEARTMRILYRQLNKNGLQ